MVRPFRMYTHSHTPTLSRTRKTTRLPLLDSRPQLSRIAAISHPGHDKLKPVLTAVCHGFYYYFSGWRVGLQI